MKNNHNPMKGLFKRNEDKKYPKAKGNHKTRQVNHAPNQRIENKKGAKQNASNAPYQRELSEIDKVYLQHMREIETQIAKLISDVQYVDSKNPVVSSQMKKIMVELITNAWKIGNIVTTLKEENELADVSQLLSKYEKRYLKDIHDSKDSLKAANELKSIKMCQNIINDSLHQISSTAEYYTILMSKLSDWGFEVKNPIGQKYNVHMDMDILAFEDSDPNLEVPVITETKKPEIYLNGNKIARAQVIVRKAGGKKNSKNKKNSKKNTNSTKIDSLKVDGE
ncbi:MAG: hypothetical protein Q4Q22_02085 [Methanosphaera sp.]|nr:hypothetical protein [Methanosphaera sp.]